MTDEQIYLIEFNNKTNKLMIEPVKDDFKDSFGWTNKTIFYCGDGYSQGMYSDYEHLEYCKDKLISCLIEEQNEIIKDANERLNELNNYK